MIHYIPDTSWPHSRPQPSITYPGSHGPPLACRLGNDGSLNINVDSMFGKLCTTLDHKRACLLVISEKLPGGKEQRKENIMSSSLYVITIPTTISVSKEPVTVSLLYRPSKTTFLSKLIPHHTANSPNMSERIQLDRKRKFFNTTPADFKPRTFYNTTPADFEEFESPRDRVEPPQRRSP